MLVRVLPLALMFAASACSGQQAPPPTIAGPSTSATSTTTATAPTTSTTTTATATTGPTVATTKPAGIPPLGDACTVAADCGIVGRDMNCCQVCGGMYGNKHWVIDVEAYCAGPGANPKCPPMNACERETAGPALGYGMSAPKCTAGRCSDK